MTRSPNSPSYLRHARSAPGARNFSRSSGACRDTEMTSASTTFRPAVELNVDRTSDTWAGLPASLRPPRAQAVEARASSRHSAVAAAPSGGGPRRASSRSQAIHPKRWRRLLLASSGEGLVALPASGSNQCSDSRPKLEVARHRRVNGNRQKMSQRNSLPRQRRESRCGLNDSGSERECVFVRWTQTDHECENDEIAYPLQRIPAAALRRRPGSLLLRAKRTVAKYRGDAYEGSPQGCRSPRRPSRRAATRMLHDSTGVDSRRLPTQLVF